MTHSEFLESYKAHAKVKAFCEAATAIALALGEDAGHLENIEALPDTEEDYTEAWQKLLELATGVSVAYKYGTNNWQLSKELSLFRQHGFRIISVQSLPTSLSSDESFMIATEFI